MQIQTSFSNAVASLTIRQLNCTMHIVEARGHLMAQHVELFLFGNFLFSQTFHLLFVFFFFSLQLLQFTGKLAYLLLSIPLQRISMKNPLLFLLSLLLLFSNHSNENFIQYLPKCICLHLTESIDLMSSFLHASVGVDVSIVQNIPWGALADFSPICCALHEYRPYEWRRYVVYHYSCNL